MAFALITSAQGQNTTASADTTGANLIVLCTGLNALGTISDSVLDPFGDSKGNTWTKLTTRSGSSIATAIYYCYNPTVGSGHTFTMANAVGAIVMAAFSGSDASPFDVENGTATDTLVTTLGTGSITPSVNDELIIAALGAGKTNQSHTLDSGMTVAQSINGVASTRYGAAIGYKIQTTAAAISPVWTWTNAGETAVAVASFKAAAGGGTSIAGALGTASASGFTGNVNANRTLAGALGAATASGFKGVVNANRTIAGALGVAAASGFAGTVGANRGIAGALGTAVASGFRGTVSNTSDTVIGGTLGTAVAVGYTGFVNAGRTIAGNLGNAAASGFTGTVISGGTAAYVSNANLYLDIGSDLSIMLGAPRMPSWNTPGRPGAPLNFVYGFNTDTNTVEVWNGSAWV